MKSLLFKFGNALTKYGEKHGIGFLIYNPIIWSFFFMTSRREGKSFASSVPTVFPDIKSAVDIGSGGGGYVAAMSRLGVDCIGYEYAAIGRFLGRLQGCKIYEFDCSSDRILESASRCDLAFTVEVGEHIPDEYSDRFVEFICRCSDNVIFSAAHPGQGGHGHVNEQPKEFWALKFESHGYTRDQGKEDILREKLKAQGYKGWLPVNLQIFSKSA